MPMPVEIVGLLRSTITFVWEDEHKTVYPARALRLVCRCAQCIEETTGKPLLANDPDTELAAALAEIDLIAGLRLADAVSQ